MPFLRLALLCSWAVSTLAAEKQLESSTLISTGYCSSSPLLTVQDSMAACSRSTTANTTTTDPKSEPDPESGGWTGPHQCAGTYCVYANAAFADGRGIVIISDGSTAQQVANLPIFTELTDPRASETLLPLGINTNSNKNFETKVIPGKGRGLVATKSLHRGERIMAHTPAMVISRRFIDDLHKHEQLRLLLNGITQLPPSTRKAFWKQMGQTDGDDQHAVDIIMNNSFDMRLADGHFFGNFPEVSMYNHDCRPNVAFHMDAGLIHYTHAVKDVPAGGELAISYVDSFRVRSVRRDRAQRNWGFACSCSMCSLPGPLANASDNRLWRIYEVENRIGDFGAGTKVGTDAVELLLSLYRQERLLESHGASVYGLAALNYNGFGKGELATKYALLALEAHLLEGGPRAKGVQNMLDLLDEPERHWSWRKRM